MTRLQLTDSERKTFAEWLLHVRDRLDWLGVGGEAEEIHRLPTTRTEFEDFLFAENALTCAPMEEQIRAFTAARAWVDDLTSEQIFYHTHRLQLAQFVIEILLKDPLMLNEAGREWLEGIPVWPTDLNNHPKVFEWLLITVWDAAGEGHLRGWADTFFRLIEKEK